jgi:hypothetical protein
MNPKKQNRRKTNANKLEPIDWREFANDAVLNGNMSTLYRRPPSEDPSAYASPEAMIEIEKRVIRSVPDSDSTESPAPLPDDVHTPTVGIKPRADSVTPTLEPTPTVGLLPTEDTLRAEGPMPTVVSVPTVGTVPTDDLVPPHGQRPTAHLRPTVGAKPIVGIEPSVAPSPIEGLGPTVGASKNKKVKPIRTVHDALTVAGQVLYRAMLGDSTTPSVSCTKGYRQLAAETHLDKDTVRDLIVEFKQKGILHETATYDPDTRLSKTYEVLAPQAVLQAWRQSGISFVTAGRQRPLFCSPIGTLITFTPTVGTSSTVGL